jgi:hypothetical protein
MTENTSSPHLIRINDFLNACNTKITKQKIEECAKTLLFQRKSLPNDELKQKYYILYDFKEKLVQVSGCFHVDCVIFTFLIGFGRE